MGDLTSAASFTADDGSVPADVAEVLALRSAGAAGIREVVTCLVSHRLLVPLLEVAGDLLAGDDSDPCAGSDRAVAAVSVREPDGTALGLAFTGTAPLEEWDASARPMPVGATRAAGAVLAEGGRALLVDSGSEHSCRIEGEALVRLASGDPWPEPWSDPAVRGAVVDELGPVLATGEVQVRLRGPDSIRPVAPVEVGGAEPGLVLEVRFPPSIPPETAKHRSTVIARRMARSSALQEVFDGVLAVRVAE